jgi:uncharacterized protein with HEPN domain
MLLRALERMLELLGECARRIPEGTRTAHPAIPWKAVVGMRNIIAHQYGRVDLDIVWRTVQRDMPPLVSMLERIVADLPPPE